MKGLTFMAGIRKARSGPGLSLRAALCACFAMGMHAAGPADAAKCGTARIFEERNNQRIGFHSGKPARPAAANLRARTLESGNFRIHYSLRGLHKVRTGPEDGDLMAAADSLYALFAGLPEAKRDSTVYARLDIAGAPHPAYIETVSREMEAAWTYYVDVLGMPPPASGIRSMWYSVPVSPIRKFPIDVVDIGTADPGFGGETYGVTYPPNELSITMENDFLHTTRLVDGKIVGSPIRSLVGGKLVHDYSEEWPLGIKVTAVHEFYHAIQFTYVPWATRYHAWYELSATGMEERLAGEVDDYLQYLPCVLKNHESAPLNVTSSGPCSHSPAYGHGIFHQYLSAVLDSAFDVRVWERLSDNGDILADGLETAFAAYGRSMSDLYPDYAAGLFHSGGRFPPPEPLFSPDLPIWPEISMDSVELGAGVSMRPIALPALTFGVLKVKWGPNAETAALRTRNMAGITRIHANADTTIVERLPQTQVTLGEPLPGFGDYYLILPNAAFTGTASVELVGAEFHAFPNPVSVGAPGPLMFSQADDMEFPLQVRVYGEDGRQIRELTFTNTDGTLAWDKKDGRDMPVKPGLYYYRMAGEKMKVLLVLP